jgi:hypothetical protein
MVADLLRLPVCLPRCPHLRRTDRLSTDWLAQAEHGGFYQALAEGPLQEARARRDDSPWRAAGQRLAAPRGRQIDVAMADGLQVLAAVEQAVPLGCLRGDLQKNRR